MIERIIEFSIRRRALIVVAAVVMAIWGVRSALRTPVDAIPDLSENQVIVFTEWAGHGPREIEEQVTFPLSQQLRGLDGVRVVRSSSDVGFSMISVIFEDSVSWEKARRRVQDSLVHAAVSLPAGVTPRLAPDSDATGQIYWYTVEGKGYDLGQLRAVQDWFIRPQLASVPGVAEVASVGGVVSEYQVELDPFRLKAFGVTPRQVIDAVAKANSASGGNVAHKGNAEFVLRSGGLLGMRSASDRVESAHVLTDLASVPLTGSDGARLRVADVARITRGAQPRRGVLEKDGNEVTGGVILMRHGENPVEVTQRIRRKIEELQPGLPVGVKIVPFYDRTPLIEGAIGVVTRTLVEAIVIAAICIFVVLLHFRTSLIIAITLPLSVLASFGLMDALRQLGLLDIQTNIMSIAGLAISIGVLVDSSIVMAENAMHHLKTRFGDAKVTGDTRDIVLPACRTVGRPIFFSVAIMLLSFLPVFTLGGLNGKMFDPLAFTKSFAMLAVALLAITLVPALCTIFVRGRLRSEEQVALVRGLTQVYRPVLSFFLDRPVGLVCFVGITFLAGFAPIGSRILFLIALAAFVIAVVVTAQQTWSRVAALATLLIAGLIIQQQLRPLGWERMTPLDEGMVMDMPISVPRMSVTQAADDLKARDMVLCRFPEVDMVVGKAGRAETATDPAPLDMIETMVNFRPVEFWPKRCLRSALAEEHARAVLDALVARRIIQEPSDRTTKANTAAMDAVALFDAQMREAAYQQNREFERLLGHELTHFVVQRLLQTLSENGALTGPGDISSASSAVAAHSSHLAMDPSREAVAGLIGDVIRILGAGGLLKASADPLRLPSNALERAAWSTQALLGGERPSLVGRIHEEVRLRHRQNWRAHIRKLNADLLHRAPGLYTRLVLEVLLRQSLILDDRVREAVAEWARVRSGSATPAAHHGGAHHHGGGALPELDPVPILDSLQKEQTEQLAKGLLLWPRDRAELAGFGGELDRAVQMPGWTNVWTMPIQNRIDMLATGVNTAIGVRVLGRDLDEVVRVSEEIAAVLKTIPGAADVIADPVRGKSYLEVHPKRDALIDLGINSGDVNDLAAIAMGGQVATTVMEGRERFAVRVRYARAYREDEETLKNLPVLVPGAGRSQHVPLSAIADVRIADGPATIKSDNGLLRNYVRLNVRGRDTNEFVAAAKQIVASRVQLPPAVVVEWTGQFEADAQTTRSLLLVAPVVVLLIFAILWWTYRDLADAVLMLITVPGALAGGVFFQWLFGYPFSVTIAVGFIACFGMVTSTSIIMLVYLREAVKKAGGLKAMSLEQLREAVLNGAVHRLRPKLLTEATTILGLAPLLWASGPGADVLRPMVVPVMGGILFADEIIDLFLPVLFYHVRRRRWQRLHAHRT